MDKPSSSSKAVSRTSQFCSLQAGRAIAALLVVLYHNNVEVFDVKKYWAFNPIPLIFDFGHAGVEFFFVLSGFIIFHTHGHDLTDPQKLPRYIWRRFIRVYPVYWLVLIAVCVVYFLVPRFGEGWERTAPALISNFLLVAWAMRDVGMPLTILVVAWTLYHEVLFYLVFGTVIFNFWIGSTLMAFWFLASSITLTAEPVGGLLSFYFAPIHLLFGFGMAAAFFIRRRNVPLPRWTAAIGVLFFLLCAAVELFATNVVPAPFRSLLYGLGSVLAVLGFVEQERSGRLRIPRVLVLMGDASYALYLVHLPVLILLAKVVSSLQIQHIVPALVWYVVFPSIAVICGIMLHVAVERPLLRHLGSRSGNFSKKQLAAGA